MTQEKLEKRFRYVGISKERKKISLEYSFAELNSNIILSKHLNIDKNLALDTSPIDKNIKSFLDPLIFEIEEKLETNFKLKDFNFNFNDKTKILIEIEGSEFNLTFDWKNINIFSQFRTAFPDSMNMFLEVSYNTPTLKKLIKDFKSSIGDFKNLEAQTKIILYMDFLETKRILHIINVLTTIAIGLKQNKEEFLKPSRNIEDTDFKYSINLDQKTLKTTFSIFSKQSNKLILENNSIKLKSLENLGINFDSYIISGEAPIMIKENIEILLPNEYLFYKLKAFLKLTKD